MVTPLPGEDQHAIATRVHAELGPDPVHVVGHSFGGQVGIELALLAPERVASLTLLCSRDTPFATFAATADALRRGDPVDVDAAMTRWFTPTELAAGGAVVAQALQYLRGAEQGRLSMPVTALAAELDPVSGREAMGAFASGVPDGRLQVLGGAAHLSPFLDPNALVGSLLAAARRGHEVD